MPTKHGVYTTQAATGVSTPSVADSGIPFVVGAAPVQSADNYSAAALGLPVLCTSFAEAKAALGYSDDFASYDLCEVMYTHFQLFGCQPVILCNMLNPTTMKATVAAADINVADHKVLLPIDAINDATLVIKPSISGTALVKGTDYEAYYSGENLIVEVIEGGSAYTATKLNIAYNKVDTSKVTGWISVDDAKAGAGLRDQTTDSRGLTKIVIDYASNVQAMAVYNLAQQLDLVAPGYYRSRYIDAAKTAQYIEIGQISAGDAEHVTTLCKKAAIEYKTAA